MCSLQNVFNQYYGKFADFLVFQFKNCFFYEMKIKPKARHKIQPFKFTVLKFQRSMIVPSIFLRFSIDFETVLSHIPNVLTCYISLTYLLQVYWSRFCSIFIKWLRMLVFFVKITVNFECSTADDRVSIVDEAIARLADPSSFHDSVSTISQQRVVLTEWEACIHL